MIKGILNARKRPKGLKRVSFMPLLRTSLYNKNLSLLKLLSRTPSKGLNYTVWRHNWPPNTHYVVSKTHFFVINGSAFIIILEP